MHERPLYYVFALFVALMVITLVSPAFGDGDVNIEGEVNYGIFANGADRAFIDVSSPPVSVNFTAVETSGSPYSAEWYNWTILDQFGHSVQSGMRVAPINWYNHPFTTPGLYSVKCMAYNGTNPTDFNIYTKDYGFVTAYLPLAANFTNGSTTGVLPLSVAFSDSSTGNPTDFTWKFDTDPVNKTGKDVTYFYSTNGTKKVALTVWNRSYASSDYCPDGNCDPIRSSISKNIFIDSREDITPIFKTNISPFTGQAKGQVPLCLQFYNNSIKDPRDSLVFNWTFGDGDKSQLENPIKTYSTPGLYTVSLRVGGNWSERTAKRDYYVNAYLPISANFSSAPAGLCDIPVFPVTYNFTTNKTMTGYSAADRYNWSFNDGTPNATTRDTSHIFNLPGWYDVTLTTLNTTHDINATEQKKVHITGLYANFTPDTLIGYQETTGAAVNVNFTANLTDTLGATYVHYDFGNGGGDIYLNSNTTYTKPGVYPVTFTVGNNCGRNSTQKNITIIERPIANFNYTPKYGDFPLSVQFKDITTDEPDQWVWDFGDGSLTVTDQNPIHIYQSPGMYTVQLTVRNTTVIPVWTYKTSKVIDLYEGFVTAFSSNKTRGVSPLTVHFTDESEPSVKITNWSWDFGDGESSTEQNPDHTFYGANNYTVNLTASNKTTSVKGTASNTIEVVEPIFANFEPNRTVRMNASVGVLFTDLSTGNISDWFWDFGDETTYDGQQPPLHIFPEFKEYPVNLTVYNWYYDDISYANYTLNVTELRAPLAEFSADPTTVNTQDIVYFSQKAEGPEITSYLWDFGDSQTSTNANPTHQYQLPGRYNVSLTVTNPWGMDTLTKERYVSVRGLIPSFMTVPAGWAVVNTPVTFIDTSYGDPVSWHWDFGDGTLDNPASGTTTHTYNKEGIFTVNLTVTNWQPTTGSISQQIAIVNKTVPQGVNFEVPELRYSGTHPLYVQFEDTTPAQANVVEWLWEFGDGSNSFEPAPNHTYQNPGEYTVTLTVRNDVGTNNKRRVAYVVVV